MGDLERFSFFLAERLGMLQSDLVERLTVKEGAKWARYFHEKEHGKESTDPRALIASLRSLKNG